jgi:hypothetical protein
VLWCGAVGLFLVHWGREGEGLFLIGMIRWICQLKFPSLPRLYST